MTFVVMGKGIFNLRIQYSPDPSAYFKVKSTNVATLQNFPIFYWLTPVFSSIFFTYVQGVKKKNHLCLSLSSFYSQSIILLVLICLYISEKPFQM